ncbi:MAG: hypothetical protein JXL84_08735 [Deltaproteobacteria bacterium]|nr:hypothetical protein [Deltaproteobacteria bacterium]
MSKQAEFFQIVKAPEYPARYLNAKSTSTCIRCGKPAKEFMNASSKMEYGVSGLCEACQRDLLH